MRSILATALLVSTSLSAAHAAATPAAAVPQGRLPDAVTPLAYRLDLTVQPEKERFSGHAEIDVVLKAPTRSLYMHGRDLKVASALARVGGKAVAATYTQVDPLGVVRLDFAKPLPAGKVTLAFTYDAPFGNGPAGLFHVKVGDRWYAWTQFESIDARSAYPGFDQPGYKTPFTVSVTTEPGMTAYGNGKETGTTQIGGMVKHQFETTKPLPTYLVAFGAGPFATASTSAAPSPERAAPLPVRIIATQPNKDNMDFALQNTGPIVALLEKYFGRAFPFPKLDQIGAPIMPGAMENAGADTYGDDILLLEKGASTSQKQEFGMVVAHELSHQWFGDLVTPAWWDDIWLNESFANWMGFRIGNEWRPDLKIGDRAIDEAFAAMDTDALKAGRPIHQPITSSGEIDSAFDSVTYGKGGQVVAMIAAYLGDEKFRDGVRLHLNRHAYGNATSEDFFAALAEAAKDPRVLTAMKSFVDQQGVPVVRIERTAAGLTLTQKRYAQLGTTVAPQSWTIPLCLRVGTDKQCVLLDKASMTVPIKDAGAIMPNVGGTGYYRFSLSKADWHALIAQSASLPAGEALALTDSLWAAFRAGEVSPALLVEGAKAMAANPNSIAATDVGGRLAGLRSRGMIPAADLPGYRKLMEALYGPTLERLGFDPKAGAYTSEDPDRQHLRSAVVGFLSDSAQDKALQEKLAVAAKAFLDGDTAALDPSILGTALSAQVATGGVSAASALFDTALSSDNSRLRSAALGAVGGSGDPAVGTWVIAHLDDKRLRITERTGLIGDMMGEPETRDMAWTWFEPHFDQILKEGGIFSLGGLVAMPSFFCSTEKADQIDKAMRPKLLANGRATLPLDRTVEKVHDCGVLEQTRGAEMAAAFAE